MLDIAFVVYKRGQGDWLVTRYAEPKNEREYLCSDGIGVYWGVTDINAVSYKTYRAACLEAFNCMEV